LSKFAKQQIRQKRHLPEFRPRAILLTRNRDSLAKHAAMHFLAIKNNNFQDMKLA
jgi:hypothetical protein